MYRPLWGLNRTGRRATLTPARYIIDKYMTMIGSIFDNLRDAYWLGPTFPLRHISKLLGRRHHVTTITGKDTVRIRPNSSDAAVFVQVFRKREYDMSRHGQFARVQATYREMLNTGRTPIVVDAGANIGAASIWFARQFPAARILAVEPNAANAALCRANTRHLPNVQVIEAAIGSEPGRARVSNPGDPSWAFQCARSGDGDIAVCTIPGLARAIPEAAGLFLVKIDIEGFEADLFASSTQWMDDPAVIMIELHDWLFPNQGASRNFQKAILGRDFEILVSLETLICVRLPRGAPPRAGIG